MPRRPPGMYLVCGFFALVGLGTIAAASRAARLGAELPAGQPPSVELFAAVVPWFFLLMGGLGVVVAIALWRASPLGRLGGLAWLGLWIAEEVVLGVWGLTGPAVVRDAYGGGLDTVVRILIGAGMLYYLWTVGAVYVEE